MMFYFCLIMLLQKSVKVNKILLKFDILKFLYVFTKAIVSLQGLS